MVAVVLRQDAIAKLISRFLHGRHVWQLVPVINKYKTLEAFGRPSGRNLNVACQGFSFY